MFEHHVAGVRAHQQDADAGWLILDTWRRLGMARYAGVVLLDRMWELRENLSAYDASYVALAERLGCDLLTADTRLSREPGIRCPVTVVPGVDVDGGRVGVTVIAG